MSMKFHVLGCAGGQLPGHNLSCYLVDNSLLIDAGCVTTALSLRAQQRITDILITHIHLDHVMALGMLADNLYGKRPTGVNLWSVRKVAEGLKKFLFNNQIWPDFTRIKGATQRRPVFKLQCLTEGRPQRIGSHLVTAVRVNHLVPSVAFFIENNKKALLHVGDTGPTSKVWSLARRNDRLAAVVIETSFPNRLQAIANASRHLTPQTLARETEKLGEAPVPILVTHLKPEYRREISAELKKLNDPRLRVLRDGAVLRF
jgi:ribonuclease BN (tRNA processing enzyme)